MYHAISGRDQLGVSVGRNGLGLCGWGAEKGGIWPATDLQKAAPHTGVSPSLRVRSSFRSHSPASFLQEGEPGGLPGAKKVMQFPFDANM